MKEGAQVTPKGILGMSRMKDRYLQWVLKMFPASKVDMGWRHDALVARLDELKISIDRIESRIDGVERNILFFNQNRSYHTNVEVPGNILSVNVEPKSLVLEQNGSKNDIFQSFWFGGNLPPLAWLSLSSFGKQRQDVELYCYERLNLPQGITWMSADEIIERNKVFRVCESYAAFSDIFRYALLLKKGGWWIDTDVFCVGREFPLNDVLFAEESRGVICGAIMKFPKNHICLRYMLWETRNCNLQNYQWGDLGPKLLTRAVNLYGGYNQASPAEKVYPIHALEAYKFVLPEFYEYVSKKVSAAHFLHFWNYMFSSCFGFDLCNQRPLPGSFLDSLYREYDIYEMYDLAEPPEKVVRETCRKFLEQKWVRQHAKINNIDI